jgi:hypothetical protein
MMALWYKDGELQRVARRHERKRPGQLAPCQRGPGVFPS